MASTKIFVAILVLTLVSQGLCCSLNDIIVGTVRTGKEIQNLPEWKVTVSNNCKCSQRQLKLGCKGFQSVEAVDSNIFAKQGDDCLLINGDALKGFEAVSFVYAWDPPFVMFPSYSDIEPC